MKGVTLHLLNNNICSRTISLKCDYHNCNESNKAYHTMAKGNNMVTTDNNTNESESKGKHDAPATAPATIAIPA